MKVRIAVLIGALVATASIAVGATAAPSEPSAQSATIVGVAAGDKRFSTLALKTSAPETYAAVTTDKALLTKVLTYHVLASRVPSTAAVAAAKKMASVKTVQGEKIKLSLKSGKLYLNGSSRVIVADVKASNGLIHAINAVLVPPSAS